MFQDLDLTLDAMIQAAPASLNVLQGADVRFDIPDRNFVPTGSTLSLFLYEVKENRELRDPVPIYETDAAGNLVRRTPPLRVDCLYMVTAWADPNLPALGRATLEHQLLGQALLWFSRFPVINRPFLRGSLDTPPAPLPPRLPPPTMVAQLDGEKNAGEFWAALGIPPRPSFSLLVTIAMELDLATPAGPPVISKEMQYALKVPRITPPTIVDKAYQIGGTVIDAATQKPIDPALNIQVLVTLVERGWQTLADEDGQFTFAEPRYPLLNAGTFTLRVEAAGFTTQEKTVTVPSPGLNEYDFALA